VRARVCSLWYPDAMRMRHSVIRGLPGCTIFYTLLHKWHVFLEKELNEHKMCVLIFSTNLSETIYVLRRTEREVITNVHMSSRKVPAILVRFYRNLNFSGQIFEKY
jgi:hypothetical protein